MKIGKNIVRSPCKYPCHTAGFKQNFDDSTQVCDVSRAAHQNLAKTFVTWYSQFTTCVLLLEYWYSRL